MGSIVKSKLSGGFTYGGVLPEHMLNRYSFDGTKDGTIIIVNSNKFVIFNGIAYIEDSREYKLYSNPLGRKLEGK